MSKRRRKILSSLADSQKTERIRVVLPDLPRFRPLADDPEQSLRDDMDNWGQQVTQLKLNALLKLAAQRCADVTEIAKVADMLIEVVPPDRRGKKGKDRFSVLLNVAIDINKGKSQRVACDLNDVDTKTFRKYMEIDPVAWKLAQTAATVIPEDQIRIELATKAEE